jgi:hypothetical protein
MKPALKGRNRKVKLSVLKSATPACVIPSRRDADRDSSQESKETSHGIERMHPHVKKLVTIVGAVSVIAASAASAGASMIHGSRVHPSCTWGASSVTATYENGRLVVSKPETSGCTPHP